MNSTRVIKFLTLTLISGALLAIPRPPDLGIGSYVLYEPSTKKIIVSFNENESVEPASLTKLMTSYVVADYLKDEFISLEDNPRISIKAWQTPGSKMFIREGTNVKVSDLIKGMIIQSGNDASVGTPDGLLQHREAAGDRGAPPASAIRTWRSFCPFLYFRLNELYVLNMYYGTPALF